MALLAGINYDPGTAVNQVCTARIAMKALRTFDASFPQLTFTVPANGSVLVRLRGTLHGATTMPQIFLGVMNGATVVARMAPLAAVKTISTAASMQDTHEALFVVSGLTPAASLTWDAAYGVDVLAASTGLKYGGPNDTTTDNAFGGFVFEVWETTNLLGSKLYDPTGGARVVKSITSLLAMTAMDTTNLRITFTAPASGKVLVRLRGVVVNVNQNHMILLGVLDGSTVKGRQSSIGGVVDTSFVIWRSNHEASFVVTGLTPSSSYTWDAAYGVEVVGGAGSGIGYGGPDDTTTENAGGAFGFEVWGA